MKMKLTLMLLLLIGASGCQTVQGMKMDFLNLGQTVRTGIIAGSYPDYRQQVNYHQSLFTPRPDPRYAHVTDISRYY